MSVRRWDRDDVHPLTVGVVTHLLSPALGQRKHHVGTERSDIVDRTFAVHHGYHLASLHRLRDLDGGRAHSAGAPSTSTVSPGRSAARRARAKYMVL